MHAISQSSPAYITDSLRLDSLKRIVPLFKDSAKVDLLNEIGLRTGYLAPDKQFIDSIRFYAYKAYNEATRLGYKSGMTMSLLLLSGSEFFWNKPFTNEQTNEANVRKAIQIAEELNNSELLAWAYYYGSHLPSVKKDADRYFDYYKKSIGYFQKTGDTLRQAELNLWLSMDYSSTGEYEKAFDHGKTSLELSKMCETDALMSWQQYLVQNSMGNLCYIYSVAGDYKSAMHYLREWNQYAFAHQTGEVRDINMSDIFCQMSQYDSALVYWNKWRNQADWANYGKGGQVYGYRILGQIYLGMKQYDKALDVFNSWSDTLRKYKPAATSGKITLLISIGQAYEGKKNYRTALQYARQGLDLAQANNTRADIMQGYQLLSNLYHHLGNNDSAYKYLLKYNTIKDSILNKQFMLRIYNSKKEAEAEQREGRLSLLDKDNKLKTEQLKQESQQKHFLLILLSILMLTGIFVYRSISLKRKNERLKLETKLSLQQIENEKRHAEFQRQTTELEMQALRAQMNPHFIFNCLSSINRFILKNEPDIASDYLTRFSRLIRMVLMNSQKSLITLEDELEMLTIYLDMERLRFKNTFDYHIVFTNRVEPGAIFIPPLLLQPFCENAIWHGLKHLADPQSGRHEHGRLDIELSMENKVLNCIITDNGIGRQRATEIKSKSAEEKKSFGLKITTERLALLNGEKGPNTFYEIEDLKDESGNPSGTKVVFKIIYRESVEEIA